MITDHSECAASRDSEWLCCVQYYTHRHHHQLCIAITRVIMSLSGLLWSRGITWLHSSIGNDWRLYPAVCSSGFQAAIFKAGWGWPMSAWHLWTWWGGMSPASWDVWLKIALWGCAVCLARRERLVSDMMSALVTCWYRWMLRTCCGHFM